MGNTHLGDFSSGCLGCQNPVSPFQREARCHPFFVLSGFVLGLSLDRNKISHWRSVWVFWLQRGLRIYPAHLVVMTAIVSTLFFFRMTPNESMTLGSSWFLRCYRTAPDLWNTCQNALLVSTNLNHITWTLRVEAIIALMFPLLHCLSRWHTRTPWHQICLLSVLFMVGFANPHSVWIPRIYEFYLGLLLPKFLPQWQRLNKRNLRWALAIVLPLTLSASEWSPWIRLNDLLLTMAAILILGYGMHRDSAPFWDAALTRKLGSISYGFYLWHFPVLWFSCFALLHSGILNISGIKTPVVTLLLAIWSISLAGLLGGLSYSFIERPFIELGRRIARQ
ncbi:MAG: acyltransferase [Candidatus Sericytochromatia bacterium]|nr:acyltransferase [Candidatus Sericytochromatia bacterium]